MSFLPAIALGLSALSATGAFDPKQPTPPVPGSDPRIEEERRRALTVASKQTGRQDTILSPLSSSNTVQTGRPILLGNPGGPQPGATP